MGGKDVENNNIDSAESSFKAALKYRLEINSPLHIFESYFNLAELYLISNRTKESIEMYQKALSISRINHLYDSEIEVLMQWFCFIKEIISLKQLFYTQIQ